jgi:hypothetical protein
MVAASSTIFGRPNFLKCFMPSTTLPDSSLPERVDDADRAMLQMSVHSLPSTQQANGQRTWNGRLKMLLVLAVCAAPVIASYTAFYVVRPQARSNYGALIDPPVPMPADARLPLLTMTGVPVSADSLKHQWLFITVAGGDCDAKCEHQLYLQRQIRESLGKDKDRVDRVWLINDQQPMRASLAQAMEGATVLRVDPAALAQWLAPQAGQPLTAQWYLVDPRGQWMMRFPPGAEPRQVLKDFNRLLKASAAWDLAGRS